MSAMQILLILATVVLLSIGQIVFKMAAVQISFVPEKLIYSFWNVKLIIALLIYAVATLTWLLALKSVPLRLAYPFAALAFFIVPLLSHYWLNEAIGWNTFAGALLILCGVILSVSR